MIILKTPREIELLRQMLEKCLDNTPRAEETY